MLFGDDVGCHSCLTIQVLGFTDVPAKVDGLQVLYGDDALGDPGGVTHASVNQPPGAVDVDRTAVLNSVKT